MSNDAGWPRARVNFWACLEVGWRWWLVALLTVGLLGLLLLSVQRTQALQLRQAQLEVALQQLRDRLEVNLALGFELGDNVNAQALLEDLLAADASLLSVEVFDETAISLFSTDRGVIGEKVPALWEQAAQASARQAWRVRGDDAFTLGLPVRGSFGEVTGQISITSVLPAPVPGWPVLLAVCVAMLVLTGVWLIFSALLLRRWCVLQDESGLDAAQQHLNQIDQRIVRALAQMTHAREEAHDAQ